MQKIEATNQEAQSANLVVDNLAQLKALFPELVTEGPNGVAVNVEVLKSLVGDATVTDAEEKYGLNWRGKRAARQLEDVFTADIGGGGRHPHRADVHQRDGYAPGRQQPADEIGFAAFGVEGGENVDGRHHGGWRTGELENRRAEESASGS